MPYCRCVSFWTIGDCEYPYPSWIVSQRRKETGNGTPQFKSFMTTWSATNTPKNPQRTRKLPVDLELTRSFPKWDTSRIHLFLQLMEQRHLTQTLMSSPAMATRSWTTFKPKCTKSHMQTFVKHRSARRRTMTGVVHHRSSNVDPKYCTRISSDKIEKVGHLWSDGMDHTLSESVWGKTDRPTYVLHNTVQANHGRNVPPSQCTSRNAPLPRWQCTAP